MSIHRAAVYNLYWSTLGGGEQVAGAFVEVLVLLGFAVDMLGPEHPPVSALKERLGLDVSAARYRRVTDDEEASAASGDYEVFVNTTYLSQARNSAACGVYYVHFPEPPTTKRDQMTAAARQTIVSQLARSPVQPRRLKAVQHRLAPARRRIPFAESYQHIVANSRFTADWTRRLWGVDAGVLYPAVRAIPALPKKPLIVSVGRFFDAVHGHSKNQLVMVEAFRALHRSRGAEGWELALVGGCDTANREYLNKVRKAALGLPVHLHVNAPGEVVSTLVGEASVYWHAGGYGQNVETHPHRFEHFGIAVVEAMSAGCVPIVYAAAGPAEIVRDGIDGLHWKALPMLWQQTTSVVAAESGSIERLAQSAARRADEYSIAAFMRVTSALLGLAERETRATHGGGVQE